MGQLWFLLLGVLAAGIGGELFIRGTVGLALAARLSARVVGITVAAFATSSPELSVSVNSALAETPAIALGDALGSNVVNVGLILALAALIAPIPSRSEGLTRDFVVAIMVAPMVGVLALDGQLSRIDGMLLLLVFVAWFVAIVLQARRGRATQPSGGPAGPRLRAILLLCLSGFALLVVAGRLVVLGAQGIGLALGLSPFVVGATMVSIGTSIPELATTVMAQVRKQSDIGLGNVLGSNIFNGFFIVGVAAIIHPIEVAWSAVAAGLVFGVLTMVLALPRGGVIGRRHGMGLLASYVLYLVVLLGFGGGAH
jgi:cation:H+ antiporter